ncbi:MAG: hypothetical protein IT580_00575 [Verrucomicrobiales bacterium]|nr:hypothetical protein [Verrucomicrobiales bacterium]
MLTERSRIPIRQILTLGILPSPLKKLIYRLAGYRIGKGVRFAFGSVVTGRDVEIGDHTRFGLLCSVRGDRIRIGAHVQIGAMTLIDTPTVEIGDGTKFNEQVFVGGLQYPDARFVVGRNCLIMQMTYINPCRSIVIGDDSGVGVNSLLIGHSSWGSKFEGYPVDFEPIVIGNSVAIAWRVTVLPGTRIQDGAVIGANSLVKGTIPPRCLAVGFPARVVAREPYLPRRVSPEEKVRYLRTIVAELGEHLTAHGFPALLDGDVLRVQVRRRPQRLHVAYAPVPDPTTTALPDLEAGDVFLSLFALPAPCRQVLTERDVVWVDIEHKQRSDHGSDLGEEAIQYLKRYGVRLLRVRPEDPPPSPSPFPA